MARMPRKVVFSPTEVAIVHVVHRVVRRCFLLGDDRVTGKNYDHRKKWIEGLFRHRFPWPTIWSSWTGRPGK